MNTYLTAGIDKIASYIEKYRDIKEYIGDVEALFERVNGRLVIYRDRETTYRFEAPEAILSSQEVEEMLGPRTEITFIFDNETHSWHGRTIQTEGTFEYPDLKLVAKLNYALQMKMGLFDYQPYSNYFGTIYDIELPELKILPNVRTLPIPRSS